MLSMIEVRTVRGAMLTLPLEDISGGYLVAEVNGLDPVKATLVSSSFARQDGSQYHSSRRENRNITMRVEFHPDWITTSVQDLRLKLYSYFMPKSEVFLRLYNTSGLVVDISGRVEDCATALFSKKPAADISIVCFDPDFLELSPVEVNGMTTSGTDEILIPYNGTVETGFEFVMNVDRTITEFDFYFRPPDGSLRSMEFAAPLVAGDVLTISTVPGAKRATLTRGSVDTSILRGVSPQSNWHELSQGDNHIRVYTEGVPIPYKISYTTRHGGL